MYAPPPLRIGVYSLPVAEHQYQKQRDYRAHDIDQRVRRHKPQHGQQHHQHLFPRVGDGGDGVARVYRQSPQHPELLAAELIVAKRFSYKQVSQLCSHINTSL